MLYKMHRPTNYQLYSLSHPPNETFKVFSYNFRNVVLNFICMVLEHVDQKLLPQLVAILQPAIYVVNMRFLTAILPMVLGFSPHLPVSVCGTGTTSLSRCFSWKHGIRYFGLKDLPHHASELLKRICLP